MGTNNKEYKLFFKVNVDSVDEFAEVTQAILSQNPELTLEGAVEYGIKSEK